MRKTTSSLDVPLRDELQRLAAFVPNGVPVVSLYLNLTPDQHGKDSYSQFLRKAFTDQLKAYKRNSPERASLERDVERIGTYLENELNRSSDGLAIFASAGTGGFFNATQLHAPIGEHWLFVDDVPHLYPLARLIDQYPRYAAVLLDTNRARIMVFALGGVAREAHVEGVKTRRTGGWSQARYQRHVENFHLHHVKEVVDTLDRVVRADNIQQIIVAGDEVAVPLLREALPPHLTAKIVDVMKFDRQAVDHEIAAATLDLLRRNDAETDAERVAEAIGAWRAGGLGVAAPDTTMRALEMGQVEELLMTAMPQALASERLQLSDALVARASKSGARIRMIEDPALLQDYGGVAALLRFRI